MRYSYIHNLECPKCNNYYSAEEIQQLCSCGSPLLARYELDKLKHVLSKEDLKVRENSLWRYHEVLPVLSEENVKTLGEGMTPLLQINKAGEKLGFQHLYLKDEGLVPTGSFKARGAAVGVSKAAELGVKELAMPTNGNAGAAWSLYSAKAGIRAHVVMPLDAPEITRKEVSVSGGELYLVDGVISDAGKITAQLIKENGYFDASTLKEPYRIEGKKTMGYEIAEQFGWELPDVILYPTGGGVGLIGIYKALVEMQELGWISGRFPRLVAVQAEGCAPIVKAFIEGKEESDFWDNYEKKAFGINVPKALGDFLVLQSIYETNGCAVAVSEGDLTKAQHLVAKSEGLFICPEGAATIAAAEKLRESGWIGTDEKVVCLNTGVGIKYPDTVEYTAKYMEKIYN